MKTLVFEKTDTDELGKLLKKYPNMEREISPDKIMLKVPDAEDTTALETEMNSKGLVKK